MPPIPVPVIDRIKSRTIIDDKTGCWLYTGRRNKYGYGIIKDSKRRNVRVHRISANIHLGLDLNSKLLALHKNECPHKHCWNPIHLYVGNYYENSRDRWNKRKLI